MHCQQCGNQLSEDSKFCGKCGNAVTKVNSLEESPKSNTDTIENIEASMPTIKCGNCGYIGEGKPARRLISKILAWLCVVFAPIVTIIYFATTYKYKCPKCQSTFVGIKNKAGVFSSQSGSRRVLRIVLFILLGLMLTGIVSSVILASLNSAREKAVQHNQSGWINYHSVADNFDILLPASPSYSSDTNIADSGISFDYHSYTSKKGETVFVVAKYIYAEPIDISNPDNLLEILMNGFVSGSEGKLVSSSYLSYKSYRALDFLSQTSDGSYKGRVVLVGETPYLLIAGYPTFIDSDISYQTFVNSLEIK